MYTYRLLSDEQKEEVTEQIQDFLPEHARLGLLSFTGSRAFGWGREDSSDIDIHGLFETEDGWFHKCHTHENPLFDVTISNIQSLDDPEYQDYRWKQYYDMSNPIFIHEDFDYEAWMDELCPEKVHHIYPYDVEIQRSRYERNKTGRNACHTYKEYMIALNYLWYDEVETNVVEINTKDKFQLSGLENAVEHYKRERDGLDTETIESELDMLHEQLGEALPEERFFEGH